MLFQTLPFLPRPIWSFAKSVSYTHLRWYLKPMEHMTETLKKIRSGKLDARFREEQKVEDCLLYTSYGDRSILPVGADALR